MMDRLSEVDARRLAVIHGKWQAARADKNWSRADRLRAYLEQAGCMGRNLELWHPVFESPRHRARRMRLRT